MRREDQAPPQASSSPSGEQAAELRDCSGASPDARAVDLGQAIGVVVLGMGRSGTSSVTRMFAKAGFFVGAEDDLMPATEANPTGHWENLGIWRVNEDILQRLKGSWFDPPSPADQLAASDWALPLLRGELDRIVEESQGAPIALKDPRIGVMMPLWEPLLDRFHPVLVVRDPLEVALSLRRRDGTPIPFALAAWELYFSLVLKSLNGQAVTVAPYARLVADEHLARSVVAATATHIEASRAERIRPEYASQAFQADLHRNHASAAEHLEHLTTRQLELWRLISSIEPRTMQIQAPQAYGSPSNAAQTGAGYETERVSNNDELARAHEELATTCASLSAEQARSSALQQSLIQAQERDLALTAELRRERERADAADAAHRQAERWLSSIQGSLSWRITAPLRKLKRLAHRRARPSPPESSR